MGMATATVIRTAMPALAMATLPTDIMDTAPATVIPRTDMDTAPATVIPRTVLGMATDPTVLDTATPTTVIDTHIPTTAPHTGTIVWVGAVGDGLLRCCSGEPDPRARQLGLDPVLSDWFGTNGSHQLKGIESSQRNSLKRDSHDRYLTMLT